MPLDAIFLSAAACEIRTAVTGGRVDKIHQPARDEIVLHVRGIENCRVLLSANPSHPRAQLTDVARENPDTPPTFCMLLRKYLTGARILAVEQPSMERLITFRFETTDELGDRTERRLVLECMGRGANLILLDGEGRVTDCLRKLDGDGGKRQVLPGLFYREVPAQNKRNPLALSREELEDALAAAPEQAQASEWLLDTFAGLSPLICRELAWRAGGRTDVRLDALGESGRRKLLDEIETLLTIVKENGFTPTEIIGENGPLDVTFLPVGQYENAAKPVPFSSFAALLDDFYAARETAERVRRRGQDMIRTVTAARDRVARRTALQRQELAAAADRERVRRQGDLITANLYQLKRGMTRFKTADFYDPDGAEVEIVLDPLLTPQQNAAKRYKEYQKAKTAEKVLTERIAQGERELDYLESVLQALALAEGERDLAQIRQELTDTGYLRRASKAAARVKKAASEPMEFRTTAGFRVSVGKNNTQNDLLTTKLASKGDLWFHTQKIHGSHVILWTQGGQPDTQSLAEAAALAAWYSQGRDSGKVPVDYTPVKFVKKPAGARPGMVVYTTYQTILAAPDGALADRLRIGEE